MTPDKRATLYRVFWAVLVSGLLVGGWISAGDWVMAVMR